MFKLMDSLFGTCISPFSLLGYNRLIISLPKKKPVKYPIAMYDECRKKKTIQSNEVVFKFYIKHV